MSNIEIRNKDCIQGLSELSDKSINLIIADLPYYKIVDEEWDNQFKTVEEFLSWMKKIILECKRILRDDGSIYLFCGITLYPKIRLMIDDLMIYQDSITWKKQRAYGKKGWLFLREEILFYTKTNDFIFNKVYTKDKKQTKGYNSKVYTYEESLEIRNRNFVAGNVWIDIPELFPRDKNKVNHPTQKPKELIERIILASSKEEDLIVDPTFGSGTTAIACKELNRNFIGFEINPEYCKIATERLNQEILCFPETLLSQSPIGESLISVKRESADSPNSPHIDNTNKEEANFS